MTVHNLVSFMIVEKLSVSSDLASTLCLFTKVGNVGMVNRG